MTSTNEPKEPTAKEAAPPADPAAEADRLRGEVQAAQDRALRATAELDNYRKRARRELEDELRYANLPLIRDLAPVIDNLERALSAAEKDPAGVVQGVRMVAQQLNAALERHGCKRIDPIGQPFDPHLHQAISQQMVADQDENTVVAVAQVGFQLHDRVVRPAQVIVSKKPVEAELGAKS